jgi:transcriptional regulator GlxA family with amidase domain
MVSRALELMGTHLEHPLSPVELCAKLGWGRSQLQEAFRVQMGMAPSEYYTSLRVLEACERLERTDASVTRIGGDLGFASTPYFSTAFKRVTGLSPQEFRRAVARYAASDEIPPPTPYG